MTSAKVKMAAVVLALVRVLFANVGSDSLDRAAFAEYCDIVGLPEYLARAARLVD